MLSPGKTALRFVSAAVVLAALILAVATFVESFAESKAGGVSAT